MCGELKILYDQWLYRKIFDKGLELITQQNIVDSLCDDKEAFLCGGTEYFDYFVLF